MAVKVDTNTAQYGGPQGSNNFWEMLFGPFGQGGMTDAVSKSLNDPERAIRDRVRPPSPDVNARSNGPRGVGRPPVPAKREPTLLDLLGLAAQFMGAGGGGGGGGGSVGPDYSALIAQLRKQAAESDSKVAAMYRQLQDSINADAPGIAENYGGASTTVGTNAGDASTAIQAAYQAARDEQTRQLQALGIEEAAGVLAAQGNKQGTDMARALSNVEQNKSINQNQLGQNQATSTDFNKSMAQTAGLEGTETRAAIQRQLDQRIAELQSQQASASGGGGGGGGGMSAPSWSNILTLTKMLQGEQGQAQQPLQPAIDPQAAVQQMLALLEQGYDPSQAAAIAAGAKNLASLYK